MQHQRGQHKLLISLALYAGVPAHQPIVDARKGHFSKLVASMVQSPVMQLPIIYYFPEASLFIT